MTEAQDARRHALRAVSHSHGLTMRPAKWHVDDRHAANSYGESSHLQAYGVFSQDSIHSFIWDASPWLVVSRTGAAKPLTIDLTVKTA